MSHTRSVPPPASPDEEFAPDARPDERAWVPTGMTSLVVAAATVAVGQPVQVSEQVVAWVVEHAARIIEHGRDRDASAAEVAADVDAAAPDRLAAFSGRQAA